MKEFTSPFAYFDTMVIVSRLSQSFEYVYRSEVYLFGYLACVLSVMGGRAAADWKYSFYATDDGLPFSPEMSDAIDALLNDSTLRTDGDGSGRLLANESIASELDLLQTMGSFRVRYPWLEAATLSASAISVGGVKSVLENLPAFASSRIRKTVSALVDESDVRQIHEDAAELREVGGKDFHHDMLSTVITWLTARLYLNDPSCDP